MKKNIIYMRNFGEGLGLDWRTVFQTDERERVEGICRANGIEFEWKGKDRLSTRALRLAVVRHPKTGEHVWFNQATHWHMSCLDQATRDSLLSIFDPQDVPRNCFYGDGTPIEDSVMDHICDVYRKAEVCFPWQKGDILMLDNMLAAHARRPFSGARKIYVIMGQMISAGEIEDSL
jgi:Taurine catabolism dioxygenase TauD, TfdA family